MRRMSNLLLAVSASFFVVSCQKNADLLPSESELVSDATLAQIKALGFSTKDVKKHEDGYLVEGDMVLTQEMLNSSPDRKELRIAEVEQYHTFNLVNKPQAITVSLSGRNITQRLIDGVNGAIARYNAENLQLTFAYAGTSGGGDINISVVNTGQYIASAGFPSGGSPYGTIKYARTYNNYSLGFVTTVIAHEMGHCIGFRHTDYMNRASSCGTGGNEGQETTGVGAVYIPGTATGPESSSWMTACLSASTDRPFNANDKKALDYLY